MNYQEFGITEAKAEFMKTRLNQMLELTLAKVEAHIKSPATYPLPSNPKSAERLMLNLYQRSPKHKQSSFFDKVETVTTLNPTQMQQRFGDLAAVDLKSDKACFEQIRAIQIPETYRFTELEKNKLTGTAEKKFSGKLNIGSKLAAQKTPPQPTGLNPRTLSLFVDSVKCIKTQDVFKDEISITGFTIDALGQSNVFQRINVGKIKKEETKQIGIDIKDFDLRAAGVFPQSFLVGFVVTDKDLASEEQVAENAIVVAIIGAVIFEIGLSMLFLSAIPALAPLAIVALLTMLLGIGIYTFGFLIPVAILSDSSGLVPDSFIFNIPPVIPIGTAFSRQLNAELEGGIMGLKGNYKLNIRWERTA